MLEFELLLFVFQRFVCQFGSGVDMDGLVEFIEVVSHQLFSFCNDVSFILQKGRRNRVHLWLHLVELFLISDYLGNTVPIDLSVLLLVLDHNDLSLLRITSNIHFDLSVLYLNHLIVFLNLSAQLVISGFVLINVNHELVPSVPKLLDFHWKVSSFGLEVRRDTLKRDSEIIKGSRMSS
jgi:hypothetical protein